MLAVGCLNLFINRHPLYLISLCTPISSPTYSCHFADSYTSFKNPNAKIPIHTFMAFHCKLLLAVLLLLLAGGVDKARAVGMVTGSVFCDQCKDGQMTRFDYPLNGAKVAIACAGSDGQMTVWKEETTNWLGNYVFRFENSPDLSRCNAQVMMGSGQGSSSGCGAAAGPARGLNLFFRMFNMELYTVDSLLSQPARPMSFCPRSSGSPVPAPAPPRTVPSLRPPSTPSPPRIIRFPPTPFFQASACPYQNWTMPQYKCYWKLVGPDTKVAVAFGLAAARKYGTDMNLWEGLQGKGDVYRTLLREGTAALLNSYNSIHFSYPTLSVVGHMNWALMGSPQQALLTAMQFKRANSGGGNVRCTFTPCK